MKKNNFILAVTMMFVVVATIIIGQTQVVFAHSENTRVIEFKAEETIEKIERETIQARERGFEIDSVIVTMTRETTQKFINYTAENFADIRCIAVEDLTQETVDYVKNTFSGRLNARSMMVDTDQFKRMLRLELSDKSEKGVLNAVEQLRKRSDILTAEPNYIYYIGATPNDTHYGHGDQWGLNGTNGISAPAAWDISTGLSTAMVGVLDTGIQASHPDLVNRISSAGLHRDCTVNPIKEPTSLTDPNGHGTHVAGIIGAQGNNGLGVAGVAWNVRLVSLRVFDANGNGNTGNITRAINFAASKNIPILNFSGGANGSDPNMQNAINGYKGLFVTAAGNDNRDVDTAPFFPSDYANTTNVAYNAFSNRVISVGSIASNGTRSSFSNYSNSGNGVTIYAPGTKILSTFPTDLCPSNCGFLPSIFNSEHHANGYHYLQGTSMATPMKHYNPRIYKSNIFR